jgi:hypothetical protein
MLGRRRPLDWPALLTAGSVTAAIALSGVPGAAAAETCSPGAHTLASPGSVLYPEMGNGGYTSVHSEIDLAYQTASNEFLKGNHVALTDRADQCLSSFSLDFERHSGDKRQGPDMRVESVEVDGKPAKFSFVAPTYPGDPNGQGDPDPRAHQASEENPVGGPDANPLPPACTPELSSEKEKRLALDGTPCPANKLLIRPPADIPKGSKFTVTVFYSGRPGVHDDGEGGVDGWFRAPDGGFVDSEPVGGEDWMPLNNYPSAKPTYTFHETVPVGSMAVANGELIGKTRNPPGARFPKGSVTWNWDSPAPIASYLVQSSVGRYELTRRRGADLVVYYQVQAKTIGPRRKHRNRVVMDTQEGVTRYQSRFNGPFPFTTNGSLIGTPTVELGQEEMQTMISFTESKIQPVVLWHENMHQWWGDNVTEAGYGMTFFKEGLADWVEEFVFPARELAPPAFNAALAKEFDSFYARRKHFWTTAPSNPDAYHLFGTPNTYDRPAAAYEALRRILGETNFAGALQAIQRRYGGSSITEPQLEAMFDRWLPDRNAACETRLGQFFTEWFDTAYPPGGGKNRPRITAPGLSGEEFYGGECNPTEGKS